MKNNIQFEYNKSIHANVEVNKIIDSENIFVLSSSIFLYLHIHKLIPITFNMVMVDYYPSWESYQWLKRKQSNQNIRTIKSAMIYSMRKREKKNI